LEMAKAESVKRIISETSTLKRSNYISTQIILWNSCGCA